MREWIRVNVLLNFEDETDEVLVARAYNYCFDVVFESHVAVC